MKTATIRRIREQSETLLNARTMAVGLVVAGLAMLTAPRSQAAIVEVDNVGATTGAFDPFTLNNDLVNAGQPTLLSPVSQTGGTPLAGTAAGLNDGSTATSPWTTMEWLPAAVMTTTFQLNTSLPTATGGYTITGVNSIMGWLTVPPWGWQDYDLQVATRDNPTFTTIYSVAYRPAGQAGTMVQLTSSTGVLATGVTAIQFVQDAAVSGQSIPHEFDVLGFGTVPEPSTVLLCGLGGLLIRRRLGSRRA